jgi:hypothetical protein
VQCPRSTMRASLRMTAMGCGPIVLPQIFCGADSQGREAARSTGMHSARCEFVIKLKTAGGTARVRFSGRLKWARLAARKLQSKLEPRWNAELERKPGYSVSMTKFEFLHAVIFHTQGPQRRNADSRSSRRRHCRTQLRPAQALLSPSERASSGGPAEIWYSSIRA